MTQNLQDNDNEDNESDDDDVGITGVDNVGDVQSEVLPALGGGALCSVALCW